MQYDILEALNQIAVEKNMEIDYVIETLKSSLVSAARKKYGDGDNIIVNIDRRSGEINMHAVKTVVETITNPYAEISLKDAKEIDSDAEIGDEVEIFIPFEEFGRNAIASAKQILIQKVREAERETVYNEYIKKVGDLVTGTVQQVDKGNIIINLGRAEAILPLKEQISKEKYRQGDRIRALVLECQKSQRGPQVVLSRASNALLQRLFELEVPEIFERIIEIKTVAREPGERAKVAVVSADERIDPVGACVGVKGVRVQAIVRELNNERIDIVPYHPDPEIFVTRALAPAKVVRIDTISEENAMTIVVADDQLSLAIGKGGQNARLASKLTGWKVNILSEHDFYERKREEAEAKVEVSKLPIGEATIQKLIAADFRFIQDILEVTPSRLTEIDGVGPKKADQIIEAAREYMFELQSTKTEAEQLESEDKEEEKEVRVAKPRKASDLFVDNVEDDDDDDKGTKEK
jgi:transcription termination/antitermination protein NusA